MKIEHLRVKRRYLGGALLADFAGEHVEDSLFPESWIASDTRAKDGGESGIEGLSRLPTGQLLHEAILDDSEYWLGEKHVNVVGPHVGFLVKLLDAAQRLPIHAHPAAGFAQQFLDSQYGKAEAWYVVDIRDSTSANVWVGMKENVVPEEFAVWVHAQDIDAIFAAMNHRTVAIGDIIYVPGGVPHTFDAGLLIAELQEPTDFSLHLEWNGYPERADVDRRMGLPWETALSCLDLNLHTIATAIPQNAPFACEVVDSRSSVPDGLFSIWITITGRGSFGEYDAQRGDVFVLPAAQAVPTISGTVSFLRCWRPV